MEPVAPTVMNFKTFQTRFRPLVDAAWLQQCQSTGIAPNNRTAKDTWYREQLWTCCHIRSTTDARSDANLQHALIEWFRTLTHDNDNPHLDGWTGAQNARFAELAAAAWKKVQGHTTEQFDGWLDGLLAGCVISSS